MSDYDHDPAEAVDPQADEGPGVSEQRTAAPPGRQRSRARPRRRGTPTEEASPGYSGTNSVPEEVESGDGAADGSGAAHVGAQRPAMDQPADEARDGAVENGAVENDQGEVDSQRQAGTDDGPASPLDDGDAVAGSDNTDYAAQSPAGVRSRRERTSRRRRTGDREPGEGAEGDHGARERVRERYHGHSQGTGHGAVAEQLTVAGEEMEPQGADDPAPESAGIKRLQAMKEAAARSLGGLKEKLGRDAPEEPSAEEEPHSRSRTAAGRDLLARHRSKALAGALLLAVFGYLGLGGPLPFGGAPEQPQRAEQGQVPDQPAGSAGSADPGTGAGEEGGGPGGDSGSASGSAAAAEPEITDTGKSFNAPVLKDGEATIESGDRSWEGTVEEASGGDRQVISVQGPTNASFETSIAMPSGDMATGAFTGRLAGDAGPEGAAYRATYNRFDPDGEDGDLRAHGEYFISGEDGVIAQGSYVDRREAGDKVVRTYTDAPDSASGEGRKISVSFEAPENALVPELVGYEVAG